jgi:uncharacterized membrane protein
MNTKIKKIVWAGLFAALVFLATAIIKLPTGVGYINAGDAVALLGAFLLGSVPGALASGFGGALADLMTGYAVYAPATLIIKALMAFLAGAMFRRAKNLNGKKLTAPAILGASLAELIMIVGYLTYEAFFIGIGGAALANVPFNAVQGVFGALAACALYASLIKIPYVRDNF